MHSRICPVFAAAGLCLATATGCAHSTRESVAEPATVPADKGGVTAQAVLQALGTSGISGLLTFTAVEGGVRVDGSVEGLQPGSSHGIHVHEKGDCSAPDGASAGGHFNPTGKMHSGLDSPESHLGDFGNLVADDNGVARISAIKRGATLGDGSATDFMGRGVIIHALFDDLTTQPAGASGARVACGAIAPKNAR